MAERVYVETSVIGAYFDERADIVSSAQRYWSRLWWDEIRGRYEVVMQKDSNVSKTNNNLIN